MRVQVQNGLPVVSVQLGASDAYQEFCARNMEPAPRAVIVRALIDTGASITVVDAALLEKLRLRDRGFCRVRGFDSTSPVSEYLNYDVSLAILDASGGPPVIRLGNLQAVSADLRHPGYEVLLGADVLTECIVALNLGAGEMLLLPRTMP